MANTETFQNDLDRFVSLLTENVAIVNIVGIRVLGREALARAMKRALETRLANVRTKTEITDIRFVRPDVAVVSCIKHVSDQNPDASESLPSSGALTFVVVLENDGWRIALAQTTPIQT